MKKDAEEHAGEDEKKKELIEARNLADQLAYTAEKSLTDYKDKITDDVKTAVEGAVKKLKEAKEKDDLEAIKAATEKLSQETQKIGQAMAGDNAAGQGAEAAQTEGEAKTEGEGNVRDAEVSDDDEKKDEGGETK
jgi:molecular chaperone DnaK